MSKALKLKYINLGLSQKQLDQLNAMAEETGFTKSQIIRDAVNAKYEEMQKKLYGYAGLARTRAIYNPNNAVPGVRPLTAKQHEEKERERRIAELEAMPVKELNDWLLSIGYISEPVEASFNANLLTYNRIVEIKGVRQLMRFSQRKNEPDAPPSSETMMMWDAFLNDLKKKDFI